MTSDIQVVVLGDIYQQTILVPEQGEKRRFTKYTGWIGAPLLQQMIRKAIGTADLPDDRLLPDFRAILGDPDVTKADFCNDCHEYIAVLAPYPQKSGDGGKDKALRIYRDFHVHPRNNLPEDHPDVPEGMQTAFDTCRSQWIDNAVSNADRRVICVLYDRGMYFNRHDQPFEKIFVELKRTKRALVYAFDSNHLPSLRKIQRGTRHQIEQGLREDTIIVVTVKALRKWGNCIVEFGSIEQAVDDVVSHVDDEPLRSLRARCAMLVVIFNETSALCLHNETGASDTVKGTIHVGPNFDRIAQIDPKRYGSMPAKVSLFVSALVRGLHESMRAEQAAETGSGEPAADAYRVSALRRGYVDKALRLGVVGFNFLYEQGFRQKPGGEGRTDEPRRNWPFACLEDVLSKQTVEALTSDKELNRRENLVSSLSFDISKDSCRKKKDAEAVRLRRRAEAQSDAVPPELRPGGPPDALPCDPPVYWSRLHALVADRNEEQMTALVHDIVRNGTDVPLRNPETPTNSRPSDACKWFPEPVIQCPYIEFGKYKTIDDREAASYLDIAKLIYKYLNDEDWDKPLSLAVFGPPGAGKSFAVKEILKFASPAAAKKNPLEFNLAQFGSVEQLTGAFHQVQDRALADDDVPLVIFDEFDSAFGAASGDGRHGWLKYFLAPMQDGLFRGGGQDYRVGRAIFLFSGGVTATFDAFEALAKKGKGRKAKLPDFISRLRGHLTVSGINYEGFPTNVVRVKRAMLLRSLIEKHAKPILVANPGRQDSFANIRDSVIDRFVDQWNYFHGIRSMEAVVQSSRWVSGLFAESSLPSSAQLSTHVYLWEKPA